MEDRTLVRMEEIITVCTKCGKVLTTTKGRLEDAYFGLRKRKLELLEEKGLSEEGDIVYAWCYNCYEEEKYNLGGER